MPNMHEALVQSVKLQRKDPNRVEESCLDLTAMRSETAIVHEIKSFINDNQTPKVNKVNAQFTKNKNQKRIAPSKSQNANQNFLLHTNLMTDPMITK